MVIKPAHLSVAALQTGLPMGASVPVASPAVPAASAHYRPPTHHRGLGQPDRHLCKRPHRPRGGEDEPDDWE